MFKIIVMCKIGILILILVAPITLSSQDFSQGFEGTSEDNWTYASNIPFYSLTGGVSDLWDVYSGVNGRIEGASNGFNYIAGSDLDNSYSESVLGETAPVHILTFETIDVNGAPAELSFKLNYALLDKSDYIFYEIAYDDGNGWSSPDIHVDVFKTSENGYFLTDGWQEYNISIPAGKSHVRFRIGLYQNGNGYIGLDDFQLHSGQFSTESTESIAATDKNFVERLTFGPNPTKDFLRLKAQKNVARIVIFDISGNEVFRQAGKSKEMVMNISNLTRGIYLAMVESDGTSQTIKVVKN